MADNKTPNTGGGGTGQKAAVPATVKPTAGIFTMPSIRNMATFGLQTLNAVSSFRMQKAQAALQTANAEHQYWTEYASTSRQNYRNYEYQLDSWYRQSDYTERRRQYEFELEKQKAVYKGEVSTAATKDFQRKLADLEGQFYEKEAKEIIELENIRTQSISNAAKVAASGQVGRTTAAMKTAFNQQWLSNLSNRQMTRKFRIADKLNAGEALNAARQNTINQVNFYTPQPVSDPVKPLAPLPIQSVEPTPVSGPSELALGVKIFETGVEAYERHKAMLPKKPTASATTPSPSSSTPAPTTTPVTPSN